MLEFMFGYVIAVVETSYVAKSFHSVTLVVWSLAGLVLIFYYVHFILKRKFILIFSIVFIYLYITMFILCQYILVYSYF